MISRNVPRPPGEPMEEPEQTIHPDPEVVANAWVGDWRALEERAAADLEGYWAERAGELEWSRRWDTVLDESGAPSTVGSSVLGRISSPTPSTGT